MECKLTGSGYLHVVEAPEDRDAKDVFERLVIPEIPMLMRVAASLTGQSADAHDLVQETLLRAWRSITTFDGAHPKAWLLTIMRNANHNTHRKPRPEPTDPHGPIPGRRAGVYPSAESVALDGELDQAIAAGIRDLSSQQRQLITLVDINDLSYRKAATVLNIPEGTVMSGLHRARARIRKRIVSQRILEAGTPT